MIEYTCLLCGKSFDSIDAIRKHLEEVHRTMGLIHDCILPVFTGDVRKALKAKFDIDEARIRNFGYAGLWVDFFISDYMYDRFWKRVNFALGGLIKHKVQILSMEASSNEYAYEWNCEVYLPYEKIKKLEEVR